MHKNYKVLSFILLTAFITGSAYFMFLYFQPVKNIASQKADIQLTDLQLIEKFNTSSIQADSFCLNKIIELTGTINKTEINDSICNIIFDNGGNFIIVANCIYKEKQKIEQLKEGNEITVKGIYSGFIINDDTFMIPAEIKIDKCTLLK